MRVLFTLCLFFVTQGLAAQNWEKVYSDSQIEVFQSDYTHEVTSNNHSHERVIFKYTNLTNKNISFSISREHYYDGKCSGCKGNENSFQVSLSPNESKEFDAVNNKDKTYYVFKKDNRGFIKRQLTDLKITKIKYH